MFRYRLRTLILLTILGPPFIAWYGPTVYESVKDFEWHGKKSPVRPDWAIPVPRAGELMVEGKSYGDVKIGDQVMVRSANQILVNGKRRSAE